MSFAPETTSDIVTSWLPFPLYTPPSICSNIFVNQWLNSTDGWQRTATWEGDCYPDIPTPTPSSSDSALRTTYHYGPLTCPAGWTTVSSSSLVGSTVSVGCCPPGYTLQLTKCHSTFTTGQLILMGIAQHEWDTANPLSTTTVEEITDVWAPELSGRDIVTPSSAGFTTTQSQESSPTEASAGSLPATNTPNPTAQPIATSDNSPGLSTGAKAGIGVGVSVCVLAIIAILLAVFFIRRRGQKADRWTPPPDHYEAGGTEKPRHLSELHGTGHIRHPSELYGDETRGGPFEMLTQERRQELAG